MNANADVSIRARGLNFGLSGLHPHFLYVRSEGSGKSLQTGLSLPCLLMQ